MPLKINKRSSPEPLNSKISFKSRTTKDVTSIVKKELAIFEVEGKLRKKKILSAVT
jgi:hypothetical protein